MTILGKQYNVAESVTKSLLAYTFGMFCCEIIRLENSGHVSYANHVFLCLAQVVLEHNSQYAVIR